MWIGKVKVNVIASLKSILLLFLPLSFLLLLLFFLHPRPTIDKQRPAGILIRPGYENYDQYISKQLNKTLNSRLRRIWTTRDWDRKIRVFASFFNNLVSNEFLSNSSRSLCIGARVGQEVVALREIGVSDAVGMDLVPYPPLVVKGDFHNQPFLDESFDFEFSNVFDHALYPEKFVGEVERTLKVGGVCVLHVALKRKGDKYSANDLYSVDALIKLFRVSTVARVTQIDGFGLDTEVVLRKTSAAKETTT